MQYDKQFGSAEQAILSQLPHPWDPEAQQDKQIYICSALSDIFLDYEEILDCITENLGKQPKEKPIFLQQVLSVENYNKFLSAKKERLNSFYAEVAQLVRAHFGSQSVFLPQEHFDVVKNADASPQEVFECEYAQIKERTWLLIVIADHPSWGGGMEVGWCADLDIPIIILAKDEKYVSRLLRGAKSVKSIIRYTDDLDALELLDHYLIQNYPKFARDI